MVSNDIVLRELWPFQIRCLHVLMYLFFFLQMITCDPTTSMLLLRSPPPHHPHPCLFWSAATPAALWITGVTGIKTHSLGNFLCMFLKVAHKLPFLINHLLFKCHIIYVDQLIVYNSLFNYLKHVAPLLQASKAFAKSAHFVKWVYLYNNEYIIF